MALSWIQDALLSDCGMLQWSPSKLHGKHKAAVSSHAFGSCGASPMGSVLLTELLDEPACNLAHAALMASLGDNFWLCVRHCISLPLCLRQASLWHACQQMSGWTSSNNESTGPVTVLLLHLWLTTKSLLQLAEMVSSTHFKKDSIANSFFSGSPLCNAS